MGKDESGDPEVLVRTEADGEDMDVEQYLGKVIYDSFMASMKEHSPSKTTMDMKWEELAEWMQLVWCEVGAAAVSAIADLTEQMQDQE